MRKLMMIVLLASAAAPVLARPNGDPDKRASRSERSESRATVARAAEVERPARSERSQGLREHVRSPRAGDRPERAERPLRQPVGDQHRDGAPASVERSTGRDTVRDWRPRGSSADPVAEVGRGQPGRGLTQQPRDGDIADRRFRQALDRRFGDRHGRMNDGRPYDGAWNEHRRELAVSTIPRFGTQPPLRTDRERRNWSSQWSRDWRDDRRYDWRHHRDRNRSLFSIGFYYDPFGWNYQRYNIGWRMWPSYYGRSHWLNDPWHYRLPPSYPGTQWIRYHGDAILVDTWTGEVIDVIHDFFW